MLVEDSQIKDKKCILLRIKGGKQFVLQCEVRSAGCGVVQCWMATAEARPTCLSLCPTGNRVFSLGAGSNPPLFKLFSFHESGANYSPVSGALGNRGVSFTPLCWVADLCALSLQSDPEFVQWKKELTEAFTEAQKLLRRAPKVISKTRTAVVELSKPPLTHRNSNGL